MSQVPDDIVARLADYQAKMVHALELLTDESRLEQQRTVIVQQALMLNAIEALNTTMREAVEKVQTLGGEMIKVEEKKQAAMWSLLKIPIVICIVGASSWAFTMHEISENSWMIIMAVAVFPWMGESITAIAKIFGLGRGNQNGAQK